MSKFWERNHHPMPGHRDAKPESPRQGQRKERARHLTFQEPPRRGPTERQVSTSHQQWLETRRLITANVQRNKVAGGPGEPGYRAQAAGTSTSSASGAGPTRRVPVSANKALPA